MRSPTFAFIALVLAASTTAWAGDSRGADPAGDENSWPVVDGLDCRAPGIDIVGLHVESADGLVTARLSVLDLADEGIHCQDALGAGTLLVGGSYHRVAIHQPYACDVACTTSGPSVRFTASASPEGPRSACGSVFVDDGLSTGCIGEFASEGSTLVWSLPVSGIVGEGADARSYDLSGVSFLVDAQTVGGNMYVTGLMFDYADAPGVTL